jgi:hyperosmotically inducible protein
MLKKLQRIALGLAVPILLLALAQTGMAVPAQGTSSTQPPDLQQSVRHSILMLPYYGVFDRLNFSLNGSTVTLTGEVRRAVLKNEAEWAVSHAPGVTKVINKIEILPVSSFDDAIRWRIYHAIFSQPGMWKYRIEVVKPIRIIVKNGHVTLYGIVDSKFDRQVAEMAANRVPYVFSVTDDLRVG